MTSAYCDLCNLNFKSFLELQVHTISLGHHVKTENRGITIHECSACDFTCSSLPEYSKHVDSADHGKKKERLLAILDTSESCREPVQKRIKMDSRYGYTQRHVQAFQRNGPGRKTCPASLRQPQPPTGFISPPVQLPPPVPHQPNSSTYANYLPDSRGFSDQYDLPWNAYGMSNDQAAFHRRTHDRQSFNGRDSRFGYQPRSSNPPAFPPPSLVHPHLSAPVPVSSDIAAERSYNASLEHPKRGILARLSIRKKDTSQAKDSTSAQYSTDTQTTQNVTPDSKKSESGITLPASSTDDSASVVKKKLKKKTRMPGVLKSPIPSKLKKWCNYKTSGRMSKHLQRDRMNKFRLVDTNGRAVEDLSEEDHVPSKPGHNQLSPLASLDRTAASASSLSLHSHIWGTGPEIRLPSAKLLPSKSRVPVVIPSSLPKKSSRGMEAVAEDDDALLNSTYDSIRALGGAVNGAGTMLGSVSTSTYETAISSSSLRMAPGKLKEDKTSVASGTDELSMPCLSAEYKDIMAVKQEPESYDSPPPELLPNPLLNQPCINSTTSALQSEDVVKFNELVNVLVSEDAKVREIENLKDMLARSEAELDEIRRRKKTLMDTAQPL